MLHTYINYMNNPTWGGKREGAGRKPTGRNTTTITITLKKSQAEALRKIAESKGKSVSKMIIETFDLPDAINKD